MTITSVNPGAYLKFRFTGTVLGLYYTSTAYAGVAAKQWPRVSCSIDGGAYSIKQLSAGDAGCIVLATALAAGTHSAVIYFLSSDAYTARWDGTMSLVVTGIGMDSDAVISAPTLEAGRMLAFGDSITEGAWNLGGPADLSNYSLYEDTSLSWVQIVAADLGCELGCCAFGGQSYTDIFNSDIPVLGDSWDFYFGTNSRLVDGLLSPAPDWILNNTGHNGASAATVTAWLTAARAAAPSAKIAQIVTFDGDNAAAITSGFNTYQETPDANCKLINLGVIEYETTDGTHPTVAGHATLAALVTDAINTAFGL